MLRAFILKFWPALLIFSIVFAFHFRLFFPQPSLYVTPDFGRNDLINVNIPLKTILKEAIPEPRLPLWEHRIGQGFPLFAEGQTGIFFLPNLILFRLWLQKPNFSFKQIPDYF